MRTSIDGHPQLVHHQFAILSLASHKAMSACEKVAVWERALGLMGRQPASDLYSFSAVASACANVAGGTEEEAHGDCHGLLPLLGGFKGFFYWFFPRGHRAQLVSLEVEKC